MSYRGVDRRPAPPLSRSVAAQGPLDPQYQQSSYDSEEIQSSSVEKELERRGSEHQASQSSPSSRLDQQKGRQRGSSGGSNGSRPTTPRMGMLPGEHSGQRPDPQFGANNNVSEMQPFDPSRMQGGPQGLQPPGMLQLAGIGRHGSVYYRAPPSRNRGGDAGAAFRLSSFQEEPEQPSALGLQGQRDFQQAQESESMPHSLHPGTEHHGFGTGIHAPDLHMPHIHGGITGEVERGIHGAGSGISDAAHHAERGLAHLGHSAESNMHMPHMHSGITDEVERGVHGVGHGISEAAHHAHEGLSRAGHALAHPSLHLEGPEHHVSSVSPRGLPRAGTAPHAQIHAPAHAAASHPSATHPASSHVSPAHRPATRHPPGHASAAHASASHTKPATHAAGTSKGSVPHKSPPTVTRKPVPSHTTPHPAAHHTPAHLAHTAAAGPHPVPHSPKPPTHTSLPGASRSSSGAAKGIHEAAKAPSPKHVPITPSSATRTRALGTATVSAAPAASRTSTAVRKAEPRSKTGTGAIKGRTTKSTAKKQTTKKITAEEMFHKITSGDVESITAADINANGGAEAVIELCIAGFIALGQSLFSPEAFAKEVKKNKGVEGEIDVRIRESRNLLVKVEAGM